MTQSPFWRKSDYVELFEFVGFNIRGLEFFA